MLYFNMNVYTCLVYYRVDNFLMHIRISSCKNIYSDIICFFIFRFGFSLIIMFLQIMYLFEKSCLTNFINNIRLFIYISFIYNTRNFENKTYSICIVGTIYIVKNSLI